MAFQRFEDMSLEERARVRSERVRVQRERDQRALRYAEENPVSQEERARLRAMLKGL